MILADEVTARQICRSFPEYCAYCDKENSGYHVLFECVLFSAVRSEFSRRMNGQQFSFEMFGTDCLRECREVVRVGRQIFESIRAICRP
jgi:hypothetical protein